MNNAVHEKTMENLRNRFDLKLKQQKRLIKMDIQTKAYVTQNMWQQFSRDT